MISTEKSFFKMSYRRRMSTMTSFKIVRAILADFTRKDEMKLEDFHFQPRNIMKIDPCCLVEDIL